MKEPITPSFNDAYKKRQMPQVKIRKPCESLDGLPLFDKKIRHELKQEQAQANLF